jgi:hypothetical protein
LQPVKTKAAAEHRHDEKSQECGAGHCREGVHELHRD